MRLLMVVHSQLYLEAPWHRLRTGHVWSAGSTSSHSRWRWVNMLIHFSFSLLPDLWCIFTCIDRTTQSLPAHFLTLTSSLCFPPFRGHGLQLFLWAHEKDESKLSTWRSYGYSLCQHALSNTGDKAAVRSFQAEQSLLTNAPIFHTFFSDQSH